MNRNRNLGYLALGVLGGIYLWRNRFEIQRFLERQGIETPIDRSSVMSAVRSRIAKVAGRFEAHGDQVESGMGRETTRRAG